MDNLRNLEKFVPNMDIVYNSVSEVKNLNYSRLVPSIGIPNLIRNINYSNVIPVVSKLYNNSVVNSIRSISLPALNNPLNYPSIFVQGLINFFVLNTCRFSLLLIISLWIAIFVLRFTLAKSINLCNLTVVIFMNLLFLWYYPGYCIIL